jgi:serine/threonine protein kinase
MATYCINPISMDLFSNSACEERTQIYKYIKKTFFPLKSQVVIKKDNFYGPYKLIKRIDSGVYGDVWEAIDTRPPLPPSSLSQLPHKVAIKILCNQTDSNIESYISALVELECLYLLSNIDNVVQLLDAFYIDSTVFFVLEYCEQTLHQLFLSMKDKSNKEMVFKLIFKQILQGLTEINRIGYMHLDIKPKNILINSTGTVKICDFSISHKISEIREGDEYQTAWYRSPEAINNHLNGQYFKSTYNIGYNIDVWSVGCILYEGMTSGEILFRGEDSEKMYNAIKKNRYYEKENQYINAKLSQFPILVDFIKTCLIYDNLKRPNAEQLLNHDFFK